MVEQVTLYLEMTPNPSTVKFVSNIRLVEGDQSYNFLEKNHSKNVCPLAEELFNLPFVDRIFISSNFIAITKTDNVPWEFINEELIEFISEWLKSGKAVFVGNPEVSQSMVSDLSAIQRQSFEKSELDDAIKSLLDEYVKPAVERDGGAIDFLGYKDQIVHVMMKGSCAGCPSSTMTLKQGIENLLKQHFPEISSVIAVNE